MHHQVHRTLGIARLDGVDQLVVFVVGAMRTAAAFVLGDDQRGLRHQAALEAHQRRITRGLGQLQVELAGQTNASAAIAAREAVLLVLDHLPQFGQLLDCRVLDGQFGDGALHQATRVKDLPGFFDARAGHYRTAIRPQQHHALVGQARQGAANDGAADAENLTQRLFAQLGARRQALLENGIEDMGIYDIVLSPAAAAFAHARLLLERLQLIVHSGSRQ